MWGTQTTFNAWEENEAGGEGNLGIRIDCSKNRWKTGGGRNSTEGKICRSVRTWTANRATTKKAAIGKKVARPALVG